MVTERSSHLRLLFPFYIFLSSAWNHWKNKTKRAIRKIDLLRSFVRRKKKCKWKSNCGKLHKPQVKEARKINRNTWGSWGRSLRVINTKKEKSDLKSIKGNVKFVLLLVQVAKIPYPYQAWNVCKYQQQPENNTWLPSEGFSQRYLVKRNWRWRWLKQFNGKENLCSYPFD